MRIPGIFPIAYSVIFPQLHDITEGESFIDIESDDSLHVLIQNNYCYLILVFDKNYNV